jgi:hypothetical protein
MKIKNEVLNDQGETFDNADELAKAKYNIRKGFRNLQLFYEEPNVVHELEAKKWMNMELGKGIPFYCKVSTYMCNPPLLLHFKFDNPSDQMTLYGSFSESEPNAQNCSYLFRGNDDHIKIFPKGN